MFSEPVTFCPYNSRCGGGDKDRASRWNIDRKRQHRTCTLTYADGLILLVKNEEIMKEIMRRLRDT